MTTQTPTLPIPTDRVRGLQLRRGKVCQVCRHPDRPTIELAVARGLSRKAADKRWPGLGHAIFRHYRFHVSDSVKVQKQLVRKNGKNGSPMDTNNTNNPNNPNSPLDFVQETSVTRMNDLERLKGILWTMMENSVEHGDVFGASKMSHQLHANIRLASEIAGDLERHAIQQVNNLVIAPDYLKLRTALINALRPYPEAAAAVINVFKETEAQARDQQANNPNVVTEYEIIDPPKIASGRRSKGSIVPIDIDY